MQQPIIAGVDGSPHSLRASAWAADEARRLAVPLLLVHGYVPVTKASELPGGVARERHAARHLLDDALTRMREQHTDLDVSGVLAEQPAAELLIERAREAQLVVLGSCPSGTVRGFFLGSVGHHVLRKVDRPVVLIRGENAGQLPESSDVVVGVPQRRDEADVVLNFAFRAAAERSVTLRAARAWSLPTQFAFEPGLSGLSDEHGGLDGFHRDELTALVKPWRQRYPQVAVVEHVERRAAAELLMALTGTAQLLVVGRRTGPVSRYLGHVAQATLHFADVTVALVPTH
ncbi:universal stress protein [Streptomyces sp. NPDC001914]|uniref:universal stress protein n=1 Tax=Streptomyces sp. NPDC001914 TaxID=3364623 RepID=UPI0036A8A9D4